MEGSTIIKLFVFVALVLGGVYLYNNMQKENQRELDAAVAKIEQAGQVITESGGTQPERIVEALKFIETSDWSFIQEAVLNTEGIQSNYIAAELIMRRIYEVPNGTSLPTGVTVSSTAGTVPWVLDGSTPTMMPFGTKQYSGFGGMEELIDEYGKKGKRRAKWQ